MPHLTRGEQKCSVYFSTLFDRHEQELLRGTGSMERNWRMRLSASRIDKHDRCPLRYWWEEVMKLEQSSSPAKDRGNRVHKMIEQYLLTADIPAGGKLDTDIFNAFLPILPKPPFPKNQVEQWIKFKLPGWPILSGKVDFNQPATFPHSGLREEDIQSENLWDLPVEMFHQVKDWKTTSNLKRVKKGNDLLYDIQPIIYGTYYARSWPLIEFSLVYGKTTKPHYTEISTVRYTRTMLVELFKKVYENRVRKMIDTFNCCRPEEVEHNLAACKDYGGCDWLHHCSVVGVEVNGIFSRLAKRSRAINSH